MQQATKDTIKITVVATVIVLAMIAGLTQCSTSAHAGDAVDIAQIDRDVLGPSNPLDSVTCEGSETAPCNINYIFGQGASFPYGGATMSWYAFALADAPSFAFVSMEMRDSDGVSRRFFFTPDGMVDLRRAVNQAGAWLDYNGATYSTVAEFDGATCPQVCETDDAPPPPAGSVTSSMW